MRFFGVSAFMHSSVEILFLLVRKATKMSATNSAISKHQPYTGIEEFANALEDFAISEVKASANKMLKIANITFKGQPLFLKSNAWMRIVYEPSVYNGTGEEERKNIVLELTPEIEQVLATMEDTIRQTLDENIPNIDAIWVSSLKPETSNLGPTVKAKINVSGKQPCKFFDENNAATEPPLAFKSLDAKVVLRIQGVYVQKQAAGLLMTVTHMQNRPVTKAEDLTSPF
jgi:hypothetical protein